MARCAGWRVGSPSGHRVLRGSAAGQNRDLTGIRVLARSWSIGPLSRERIRCLAPDNVAALEVLVVVGADGFDQLGGVVTVGPSSGSLGCVPERCRSAITFLVSGD